MERRFLTERIYRQWSEGDEGADFDIAGSDPSLAMQPADGVPPGVTYGTV